MKTLWLVPLLLFVLGTPLFAQTEESLETSGNAFLTKSTKSPLTASADRVYISLISMKRK